MTPEEFKPYITDIHHKFCVLSIYEHTREEMEEFGLSDRDLDTVIHMGELGFMIEWAFYNHPVTFNEDEWAQVHRFWTTWAPYVTHVNQLIPEVGQWVDFGADYRERDMLESRYHPITEVFLDGIPGHDDTKGLVWIAAGDRVVSLPAIKVLDGEPPQL